MRELKKLMDIDWNWNQEYFKYRFLLSVNFAIPLGKSSCKPGQFQCNNGKCIHSACFCDGSGSCENNSDESRTDGAFCGMLNYVFTMIVYIFWDLNQNWCEVSKSIVFGEVLPSKFLNQEKQLSKIFVSVFHEMFDSGKTKRRSFY